MANENVLSGLIRKRAEITAQVEGLQMQLRQLIMDADNLDGAIRLFDPEMDLRTYGRGPCRASTSPSKAMSSARR